MGHRLRVTGLGLALASAVGLAGCGAAAGSHVVGTGSHPPGTTGTTSTRGPGGSPSTTAGHPDGGSSAASLQNADALLAQLQSELGSLGGAVAQTTTDLSNPQGDS